MSGPSPSAAGSRGDDAREQPTPPDVQDAEPRLPAVSARDRDREAVRGDERHRLSRPLAPEAVALVEHGALENPLRLGLGHGAPVHLPGHRRRAGIRADGFAEPTPVLDDPLRIVLREDAEVERLEGAFAHSPEPRREHDPVGLGSPVPLEQLHAASTSTSITRVTWMIRSVSTRVNWSWKRKKAPNTTSIPYWSSRIQRT